MEIKTSDAHFSRNGDQPYLLPVSIFTWIPEMSWGRMKFVCLQLGIKRMSKLTVTVSNKIIFCYKANMKCIRCTMYTVSYETPQTTQDVNSTSRRCLTSKQRRFNTCTDLRQEVHALSISHTQGYLINHLVSLAHGVIITVSLCLWLNIQFLHHIISDQWLVWWCQLWQQSIPAHTSSPCQLL